MEPTSFSNSNETFLPEFVLCTRMWHEVWLPYRWISGTMVSAVETPSDDIRQVVTAESRRKKQ